MFPNGHLPCSSGMPTLSIGRKEMIIPNKETLVTATKLPVTMKPFRGGQSWLSKDPANVMPQVMFQMSSVAIPHTSESSSMKSSN